VKGTGRVCIDTNVLFYILKFAAGEEGESEHDRETLSSAGLFLDHVQREKLTLMLPSLVLAEYMRGVAPELHTASLRGLIDEGFQIAPFDAAAAMHYARIVQHLKAARAEHPELTRPRLTVDYMVAATAIAHRADCLYTEDRKFIAIMEAYIVCSTMAQGLPPTTRRLDL
jgi:predicted nucleic acid-binding protein